MLLFQHHRLWALTSGGHSHTHKRDLNVAPGQWVSRSCTIVTCSCVPARLCIREGGNGSSAVPSRERRELQHYFLDTTHGRQEKKRCNSSDFKEPVWVNCFYKPAGVLPGLDKRIRGPAGPTSNPTMQGGPGPPTSPEWERDATAHTVIKLCEKGELSEAVEALSSLVHTKSPVSTSLLCSVLRRCVAEKNLAVGRRVHYLTVKLGYESNAFLGNHILRMYACQGRLQEAMDVFTRVAKPGPFIWCSIMSAYARHGKPNQAIQLYHEMRSSGVKPDGHVFVAALQACAIAADLESGRQVHTDVLESGVTPNYFVCSSLVDMYAKCGRLEDARRVFDNLATKNVVTWTAMIAGYAKCGSLVDARRLFDSSETKNVVTWNAMISGYAEQGLSQEAFDLYARMEQDGLILANGVTFASLLKVCARAGGLQQGKQLHSLILERGLLVGDIVLGNSLVEMYAKCGKMEDAFRVFNSLSTKDAVTWNVLINGYGQSNESHKAVDCFQEMLRNGIAPNEATFTCFLVACSHEGLVNEGRKCFRAMVEDHGVTPTIEHYTCMVDLLGRAGHLEEAENMLLSYESNDVGFTSLLNACRSYGDIERAIRCFKSLVSLDPEDASAYVLMANMYADAGKWTDVDRIQSLRKLAGASKKPAMAGIEVNKQVHTFVVGDKRDDISRKVQSTNVRLKVEGGHVPHTELVLKPLSQRGKEDELCGHAEKLALAYGLLHTPNGTPLLVTKNLRMCRDCHSSTEIMSRIEKRDIVVRDAYRVHRFEAGFCSCKGRP